MFTSSNTFVKQARLRAFTLMELSLALSILTLLAGTLFAIVDATFRASSELQAGQDRNREISAFLSLCRQTFANLPAPATFQAQVVPDGRRYSSQLIFRNAPGLMAWGDSKNTFDTTILAVREQVGGLAGVGILQDSDKRIQAYLNGDTGARQWLMLLRDLRDAQWRFYDPATSTWVKEWNNITARPAYAELTLTTADDTQTYVFKLPPVAPLQQALPLP